MVDTSGLICVNPCVDADSLTVIEVKPRETFLDDVACVQEVAPEAVIRGLHDRLERQDAVLQALMKRLAETETRLERQEEQAFLAREKTQLCVEMEKETSPKENFEGDKTFYRFQESIWDAGFLMFVGDATFVDLLVLGFGGLVNAGLQVLLLVIIALDMLDNPFNETKVREMIDWRVDVGHANSGMDSRTGMTTIYRLCNRKMWSFEQSEYAVMSDYLYKPVPGYVLTVLAITLWTLTTMSEYRLIVDQAIAILRLPPKPDRERRRSLAVDKFGSYELTHMTGRKKILALMVLSLPRLAILITLTFVGCMYLAQTVSLADIVLNAVALAFVLEIDEQICHVLLSQRLKARVVRMKPLPCGLGADASGAVALKDCIRWMLTISIILIAVFEFLVPFNANVSSAAVALCGGDQNFTFEGGTTADPLIVLKPSNDWQMTCNNNVLQQYVSDPDVYNMAYNASVGSPESLREADIGIPPAWRNVNHITRAQEVLNYAFSGGTCSSGITEPVRFTRIGERLERRCVQIPYSLMKAFKTTKNFSMGSLQRREACPRFEPELGSGTCAKNSSQMPAACVWSWLSHQCEKDYVEPTSKELGGLFQRDACGDDLRRSCDTWAAFGKVHPSRNCDILKVCADDKDEYDCMTMRGEIVLNVSDMTAWRAANQTITSAVVQQSLAELAGVPEKSVSVMLVNWDTGQSQLSLKDLGGILAHLNTALLGHLGDPLRRLQGKPGAGGSGPAPPPTGNTTSGSSPGPATPAPTSPGGPGGPPAAVRPPALAGPNVEFTGHLRPFWLQEGNFCVARYAIQRMPDTVLPDRILSAAADLFARIQARLQQEDEALGALEQLHFRQPQYMSTSISVDCLPSFTFIIASNRAAPVDFWGSRA
eukprot:TRINITY_DN26011_c0_g1_i1.p1 TRINITY_DN26011_c0_g1~~TRINITY_DN26011_c0_g1_i1.p1  ORF type:complete len:882 (-),score=155.10 TRINITY_DN26011_c0_g1_i1:164-2809(-)